MIENYSITEWIAFFFIYSFLGWCIESAIVSFNKRKLTNRGFVRGPFCPIYGFAATVRFGSGNHAVINTLGKG